MNVDLMNVIDKLSGAGLATLLILVLYGGFKRWWVFGWQLEEMRLDRDQWQRLALRGTDFAERAVNLVATVKTPQP